MPPAEANDDVRVPRLPIRPPEAHAPLNPGVPADPLRRDEFALIYGFDAGFTSPPVPVRPPGWRGNWPPARFRDLDESLDCIEHLLRLAHPDVILDLARAEVGS